MQQTQQLVSQHWKDDILPTLHDYIRIPNLSPNFDPQWAENGHMDKVVALAVDWVNRQGLRGAKTEVLRLPGRTPVILIEIHHQGGEGTVILYGHLDKQPPFDGWRADEGLGPWTPVLRDGRLYGRGGADDGYALFASVSAILALQKQGIAHPRLVLLIECSEESGSPDLPFYIDKEAHRIGSPKLIVCLDSGCGDYNRLWNTTSLRGLIVGLLTVKVLREGFHSGDASGIVASSFRIARSLLDRIEDAATGKILLDELYIDIPELRQIQARQAAEVLGSAVIGKYPFVSGMTPVSDDITTLLLNRTWRPALSVVGQSGMPMIENAGNVLRPFTTLKLSLRVPPGVDAKAATAVVRKALTVAPPYGSEVTFEGKDGADGWEAPAPASWLEDAVANASQTYYGQPAANIGEGGSIPFMKMLGDRFPAAQFLITGVLGPESNAHGPNEFLHVPYAEKLTACVASILADTASAK